MFKRKKCGNCINDYNFVGISFTLAVKNLYNISCTRCVEGVILWIFYYFSWHWPQVSAPIFLSIGFDEKGRKRTYTGRIHGRVPQSAVDRFREPDEYNSGHILGARNIPLSQLKMRLTEIRKDKPVYLYCTNAMRSGRAARILRRNGYKELYHLKGGFKTWTGKIKVKK